MRPKLYLWDVAMRHLGVFKLELQKKLCPCRSLHLTNFWQTHCQSNWLLCAPQQRTWLWNLKIKTKAPSSSVCKSTPRQLIVYRTTAITFLSSQEGQKRAQERWLTIQFGVRRSPGTDRHGPTGSLIREVKMWPPGRKETKHSAVVKHKHRNVPTVFGPPLHLMRAQCFNLNVKFPDSPTWVLRELLSSPVPL